MPRSLPPPAQETDLTPEGVPVPRFTPWRGRNHKANGWTAATQRAFIRELTRCGSARAAAAAVGKSVRSAYLLRDKPGAASFSCAWDQAVLIGRQGAVDAAIGRALHGELVPVFRGGRQTGVRLKHNDRLLLGALNAVGKNVRNEREVDYADLWNRLLDWEDELNRRHLDLVEDPGWAEGQQADAEAAHEARIWRAEIARQKKLEKAREIRATLKRAKAAEQARKAGPRIIFL